MAKTTQIRGRRSIKELSWSVRGQMRSALKSAIDYFGSQGDLAKAVGVKQPSIAGAVLRGAVSPKLAESIHRATHGAVPKWDLRPDKFKAGK